MSTILLTPTHIASDHTVIYNVHPHMTVVDPEYRKLFIPEHRRFVIGTAGNFDPKEIDTEACYTVVESLLSKALHNKTGEKMYKNEDVKDAEAFLTLFDKDARTFVVTKEDRFIFYAAAVSKELRITRLGDIVGAGSGGDFGAGMLMGGADIETLWEELHRMDNTTSVKHTIISLDSLADYPKQKDSNDTEEKEIA